MLLKKISDSVTSRRKLFLYIFSDFVILFFCGENLEDILVEFQLIDGGMIV
jgi:hypothetical protein